jgi:alkyl sulfatase BDS1-like metallo-beta-lactamase superfamily hydrolase
LNGPKAAVQDLTIGLELTDESRSETLLVRNGTLSHRTGIADDAEVTVSISRASLDGVILGENTIAELTSSGNAQVRGDAAVLERFVELLDTFEFWFNFVTPWGARTRLSCCGEFVFVDQAAE